MSFSGEVREELLAVEPRAEHCRTAELYALWTTLAEATPCEDGSVDLAVSCENPALARKFFTLIQKTTIIKKELSTGQGEIRSFADDSKILGKACCRRAYLRGMFLVCGSMSDPEKEYHLEFVCGDEAGADKIREVLRKEGIEAGIVQRKKHFVVYVKESAAIVNVLNLMGAHKALMNMENSRILKEIANNVNRQVNCETSNLMKTITASGKQIEDIEYIETHGGLGQLPESLRKMAEIRLEYRDATLRELGERMVPPVGKSGVNHRLLRLSEIADRLREENPAET